MSKILIVDDDPHIRQLVQHFMQAEGFETALAGDGEQALSSQKIKGFQLGTDDYLVKPFEPLELVARVKALLKRYGIASAQTVQDGAVALDRNAHQVTQTA